MIINKTVGCDMPENGKILIYDGTTGNGKIILNNGNKKDFTVDDWSDTVVLPTVGLEVVVDENIIMVKITKEEKDEFQKLKLKEKQKSKTLSSDEIERIKYLQMKIEKTTKDKFKSKQNKTPLGIRNYLSDTYNIDGFTDKDLNYPFWFLRNQENEDSYIVIDYTNKQITFWNWELPIAHNELTDYEIIMKGNNIKSSTVNIDTEGNKVQNKEKKVYTNCPNCNAAIKLGTFKNNIILSNKNIKLINTELNLKAEAYCNTCGDKLAELAKFAKRYHMKDKEKIDAIETVECTSCKRFVDIHEIENGLCLICKEQAKQAILQKTMYTFGVLFILIIIFSVYSCSNIEDVPVNKTPYCNERVALDAYNDMLFNIKNANYKKACWNITTVSSSSKGCSGWSEKRSDAGYQWIMLECNTRLK